MIREAKIVVVYGDWKEAIAKTYSAQIYIGRKKMGIKNRNQKSKHEEMWKGIAEGKYAPCFAQTSRNQQVFFDQYKLAIVKLAKLDGCGEKVIPSCGRVCRKKARDWCVSWKFLSWPFETGSCVALVQDGMIPKPQG